MKPVLLCLFLLAVFLLVGTLDRSWGDPLSGRMPRAQAITEAAFPLSMPCSWICKPKAGKSCDDPHQRTCVGAADLRGKGNQ